MNLRPDCFEERFSRLGVDASFLRYRTWKSHQMFNDVLREVRELLNDGGLSSDEVELTDVRSFVWMMKEADERGDEEYPVYDEEGRIVRRHGTVYERSRSNRGAAIEIHGLTCGVRGFNSKNAYGEPGENFMEVHHIRPLSGYGGKHRNVDPETDFVFSAPTVIG